MRDILYLMCLFLRENKSVQMYGYLRVHYGWSCRFYQDAEGIKYRQFLCARVALNDWKSLLGKRRSSSPHSSCTCICLMGFLRHGVFGG